MLICAAGHARYVRYLLDLLRLFFFLLGFALRGYLVFNLRLLFLLVHNSPSARGLKLQVGRAYEITRCAVKADVNGPTKPFFLCGDGVTLSALSV
jgi:hypothetical protein